MTDELDSREALASKNPKKIKNGPQGARGGPPNVALNVIIVVN